MTVEQMVRDLLEQAIKDNLVRRCSTKDYADTDPQCRSSGELVGPANLLAEYLRGGTTESWEAKIQAMRCASGPRGSRRRVDRPLDISPDA